MEEEFEFFELEEEQQTYLNKRIMEALFEMFYKTKQISKREYDLFLHHRNAPYA